MDIYISLITMEQGGGLMQKFVSTNTALRVFEQFMLIWDALQNPKVHPIEVAITNLRIFLWFVVKVCYNFLTTDYGQETNISSEYISDFMCNYF